MIRIGQTPLLPACGDPEHRHTGCCQHWKGRSAAEGRAEQDCGQGCPVHGPVIRHLNDTSSPDLNAPAITWTCSNHGVLTLDQVHLHASSSPHGDERCMQCGSGLDWEERADGTQAEPSSEQDRAAA